MQSMPRWSCPEGKHPDAIGPERARTNNVCRYCLPCSEKQGVLVARVCGVAEKKRERAAERAEARRRREQELAKVNAARYPWRLKDLYKRWTKLEAWGDADLSKTELRIRESAVKEHTSGNAGPRRITLTAGTSELDAMTTLLYLMSLSVSYRRITRNNRQRAEQLWLAAATEISGKRVEVGQAGAGHWQINKAIKTALAETLTPAQQTEESLRRNVHTGVEGARQVLEDFLLEQVT